MFTATRVALSGNAPRSACAPAAAPEHSACGADPSPRGSAPPWSSPLRCICRQGVLQKQCLDKTSCGKLWSCLGPPPPPTEWLLVGSCQAPSEYETSPEQLFYRIAHLNRGQQYLLWVAAVTSAGRGNVSERVTIEPAGKGWPGRWRGACGEGGGKKVCSPFLISSHSPTTTLQLQPRLFRLVAQSPLLG